MLLSIGIKVDKQFAALLPQPNENTPNTICIDKVFQQTWFYHGVLDRIEDGNKAVILVEEINQEILMPIGDLPIGSKEGIWFLLKLDEESCHFVVVEIDGEKTKYQMNKSRKLLEKLRQKPHF